MQVDSCDATSVAQHSVLFLSSGTENALTRIVEKHYVFKFESIESSVEPSVPVTGSARIPFACSSSSTGTGSGGRHSPRARAIRQGNIVTLQGDIVNMATRCESSFRWGAPGG